MFYSKSSFEKVKTRVHLRGLLIRSFSAGDKLLHGYCFVIWNSTNDILPLSADKTLPWWITPVKHMSKVFSFITSVFSSLVFSGVSLLQIISKYPTRAGSLSREVLDWTAPPKNCYYGSGLHCCPSQQCPRGVQAWAKCRGHLFQLGCLLERLGILSALGHAILWPSETRM